MIPFIRSHSELMALTKSRDYKKDISNETDIYTSTLESGQRKRYINSLDENIVNLPDLPKIIRHKWINKKVSVSKFFDTLDYNNQIQSSYDLTLLERQNKGNQEDVA